MGKRKKETKFKPKTEAKNETRNKNRPQSEYILKFGSCGNGIFEKKLRDSGITWAVMN